MKGIPTFEYVKKYPGYWEIFSLEPRSFLTDNQTKKIEMQIELQKHSLVIF
jgi:hypothetical protein